MKKSKGFSLVELSVVLVIIASIVGGVLAAQDMIRNFNLRHLVTQHDTWMSAVHNFKAKYDAIPGDFNESNDYWGVPGGNGNGLVQGSWSGSAGAGAEGWRFWVHLNKAGLIPTLYSGVGGDFAGYDSEVGVNCPETKFNNVCWTVLDFAYTGHASISYTPQQNKIWLGADFVNEWSRGGFLTPAEAEDFDTKLDDGMPLTGNIWASIWSTNCTTASSNNDSSATYDVSSTDKHCGFIIGNGDKPLFGGRW